jgi:DNA replication protein DnaC
VPINREECNLFFRYIANRYEKASTVITSNNAFSDWAELFHDPIIVTAILDRMLHHSVVINIKGNSYRLKGKIRENEINSVQKVN